MSNIIECINLSHVYPEGFTAIKGINLKVKEGEVVAILGQTAQAKLPLSNISMACLSQQMELFQLMESTLLNKLFLTYPDTQAMFSRIQTISFLQPQFWLNWSLAQKTRV
tara:strand:- start:1972 stop:2301 length:330 start_codon:yes stop_codon:yes gene_type:complete